MGLGLLLLVATPACHWTLRTVRSSPTGLALAVIASGHAWVSHYDLVEDVILGSNQTLLNTLDDLLSLKLVAQVLLED